MVVAAELTRISLAVCLALAADAAAQAFTKADSGWVAIFNGTNFDGLYSRMYTKEVTDIPNRTFSIDSGMIKVTQGSGYEQGHIGTDKKYSHYRVRVSYKFQGTDGNAGLTYHTDEVPPRMSNNWPRSIECQMQQGNAGRAYSIAMATFNTKATSGRYNPGGTDVVVCERTPSPCNARDYGASVILDKRGQWNKMEVIVRGADSAIHRINDSTVMRVWDIRIPTATGSNTFTPYGTGGLAVQAEGANINYRDWEVMELHPDNPSNWVQRLFLSNLKGGERITTGTYQITWRTLGSVPRISIYYHTGDGNWAMAADNIVNTGSYTWTVPREATEKLRVRLAAAPWVRTDSSTADNAIAISSALRPVKGRGPLGGQAADAEAAADVNGREQDRKAGQAPRVLYRKP